MGSYSLEIITPLCPCSLPTVWGTLYKGMALCEVWFLLNHIPASLGEQTDGQDGSLLKGSSGGLGPHSNAFTVPGCPGSGLKRKPLVLLRFLPSLPKA